MVMLKERRNAEYSWTVFCLRLSSNCFKFTLIMLPLIFVYVHVGGKCEHLHFYIKYEHIIWRSGQPDKITAQPWANSWYTYTELVSLGRTPRLNPKQEYQPFHREVMSFVVTSHGVVCARGEFSLKEKYPVRILEFLISA